MFKRWRCCSDWYLFDDSITLFNSCVLFLSFKRQEGVFCDFGVKWSARLKWPPNSPPEILRRFFCANKKIFENFWPQVWPEVGRKYKDCEPRSWSEIDNFFDSFKLFVIHFLFPPWVTFLIFRKFCQMQTKTILGSVEVKGRKKLIGNYNNLGDKDQKWNPTVKTIILQTDQQLN